jgi:hypothetical protein
MNQPNLLLENKHVGNLTKDNTLKTNPFSFYLFFFSFLFHYYAYHTLFPRSPFFLSPTANMPHLLFLFFLFLILLPTSFSQMYSFLHFQLLLLLHCELHYSFSRFFFFNRGWWFGQPLRPWGGSATTRTAVLVVAEPPPWPAGWPATPCGWISHPSSFTLFFFFNRVAETTPLGHWGGSATTRPASLVVAEPPPWPRGWLATPLWVDRPPLFFFFFIFLFLFFLIFRLKILKLKFSKINILINQNGAFWVR